MSVINETLDNLKRNKKKSTRALNPASSTYCEKTSKAELNTGVKRSYLIPVGFAVLVGAFFYFSPAFSPRMMQMQQNTATAPSEKQPAQSKRDISSDNPSAQKMYYHTMALLNEGNDEQAKVGLQKIIAQYPDFLPAKQVYSMLVAH